MAREISTDLKEGKGDVEYWESVLKECKLASARARLHEVHVSMLAHRLETLRRTKRGSDFVVKIFQYFYLLLV